MNPPVRTLYKIDARPDGPAQARRTNSNHWGSRRTRTGGTRGWCETAAA
jgi:hypothetical protein